MIPRCGLPKLPESGKGRCLLAGSATVVICLVALEIVAVFVILGGLFNVG